MNRGASAFKHGRPPRWISSRKSGVGTAMAATSPLWYAIGDGTIDEVFYPRIDCANTRKLELYVVDDHGVVANERDDTEHSVATLAPGVPAYVLTNTCRRGRFRLTKTVLADVRRPTLLLRIKFEVLTPGVARFRLVVALETHLVNQGADNRAWLGEFRGLPLLYAQREHVTLALGCSADWAVRHCGLTGVSDAVTELYRHGRLAGPERDCVTGNVTLAGEIVCRHPATEFTLALGFAECADAAGHQARASLLSDFGDTQREFCQTWNDFHRRCTSFSAPQPHGWDLYRSSLAVLRTHQSKRFHGGIVASLAIPWGEAHGDQDIGGYHLVWPRDLAHAGAAYLAAGRADAARQAMFYLMCTQNAAGNWTQNMWVDGTPNWTARQLDQTATFILLTGHLRRTHEVGIVDPWPAVRKAADYIAKEGPVSHQDRWEENAGYTPYTLATAIAALVVAAEFATERGDAVAEVWRAKADAWNAAIERWLYVTDTPLGRQVGVEGYYVRIAPPETRDSSDLHRLIVPLKNYRPIEAGRFAAWRITSPDVLALVRYGLRRADDPRIANTVRVIDSTLRDETRSGPAWRRFNHDGYGETADGGPFLEAGVGRCWPVLTGERAHYELARGDRRGAERLLETMAKQARHGLLPEQIWNDRDRPEHGLVNGEPTGSATPLVWAHAEFVTLVRSLSDGTVFDCPPEVRNRYAASRSASPAVATAPAEPLGA